MHYVSACAHVRSPKRRLNSRPFLQRYPLLCVTTQEFFSSIDFFPSVRNFSDSQWQFAIAYIHNTVNKTRAHNQTEQIFIVHYILACTISGLSRAWSIKLTTWFIMKSSYSLSLNILLRCAHHFLFIYLFIFFVFSGWISYYFFLSRSLKPWTFLKNLVSANNKFSSSFFVVCHPRLASRENYQNNYGLRHSLLVIFHYQISQNRHTVYKKYWTCRPTCYLTTFCLDRNYLPSVIGKKWMQEYTNLIS